MDMKRERLDFVIIGAQKSASTWLTKSLGLHSDITLPEVEFPCFEKEWPMTKSLASLSPLYAQSGDHSLVGIKNNNLLFKPESPSLIYQYNPDIKLIVVLRDPVERAISSYFWHLWVSMMPVLSLNKGMAKVIEDNNPLILEPGYYGKQLKNYLDVFPRKNIHIVKMEDIRTDRLGVIGNALSFLGVENTINPSDTEFIAKPATYNINRIKWNALRNKHIYKPTQDSYRVLWKGEGERSAYSSFINAVTVAVDRLILEKILPNEKPVLEAELKKSLSNIYKEDAALLNTLLNSNE